MNPDGYAFSFSDDPEGRMWRKTRSPNEDSPDCIGTDLNRNYDDHWSGVDLPGGPQNCASTNPCSNSYQVRIPHSLQVLAELFSTYPTAPQHNAAQHSTAQRTAPQHSGALH